MLRSLKSLEGFAIGATDGKFGKVKNFYFDDESWVIRYLVVDTSTWLGGREVLISPYSISQPNWAESFIAATISKQQIKDSPSIDSDKPVSRQYERSYLGYYGYPYYWGGTGLWGEGYYPGSYLSALDAGDYEATRAIWERHRRMMGTRTCAAATQSRAIISRQAMARSVTCKGFWWTTAHGPFGT